MMFSVATSNLIPKIDTNLNIENYKVNIPVNFKYVAGRSFIITPNDREISFVDSGTCAIVPKNHNDNVVVVAIIKAEFWMKEIYKYIQ